MGLNAFLTGLANLEKIRRAPGFFKYTEHTVAAHSFRVAMIAQTLADIEEVSGNTSYLLFEILVITKNTNEILLLNIIVSVNLNFQPYYPTLNNISYVN